ncbi:PACE efflux transporter [Roseovarius dicentrarchi]|uniref:PACE efflux transporter n=1 Tax=Roseovarius dicentrarchi TaxID=2250573 RepID=UPI000DEBEADC|nr:PACE efflux transporter [Roseovarius dicentrarchi]
MRSTADRIRHALMFEGLGLAIVVPVGGWAFSLPIHDMGIVAVVSATLATLWTYIFNLAFDKVMQARVGHTRKGLGLRIFHSALFEFGLLLVLMPFLAWYLGITLIQAFWMDIAFALFYLVYAFVYNWLYDIIFPVPGEARAPQS